MDQDYQDSKANQDTASRENPPMNPTTPVDPWQSGPSGPSSPPPRRRGRALVGILALVVAAGATGGVVATYLNSGGANHLTSLLHHPLGVTTSRQLSTAAVAARIEPSVVDVNVTLAYGQGKAEGTGMILTASGRVLTNNHVVEGAGTIQVVVPNHGTYRAHVLGVDPKDDVAVLQLVGAKNLPVMPFGNSATTPIGTQVVAIGNALGLGGPPSVTAGAITAEGRAITATNGAGSSEHLTNMLQTDASLQPGDSGGPLVNRQGQVVGMDTAAETSGGNAYAPIGVPSTSPSSVAFAIPIDRALRIASEIEHGQASATVLLHRAGFLGVEVVNPSNLSPVQAQQLGSQTGAAVVKILPGTPAAQSGLQAGDVIVSVDGHAVTDISQLGRAIDSHSPGTKISFTWVTPGGTHQSGTANLTAAPVQ
jgi:S1-C subfamily serine protease